MRNDFAVNLLPNDLRSKREYQKRFSKSIFILIIVILIFIGINVVIVSISYSYSLEAENLKKDIGKIDTEINQLKTAEDGLKELNYKYLNSEKIIKSTISAEEVIAQISSTTPANITLTSIDIDLNKDPQLLIQGKALDRRDVVVFIEALNNNKIFSNAQTTGVTNTNEGPGGIIFSISLKLKVNK